MTASTWVEQDWERREREKEEWLKSRPVCDRCGEPIQEDGYYDDEGERICEDCWREHSIQKYRKSIEDE